MTAIRVLCVASAMAMLLSCASPQTVRPELASGTLADEQHRQSLYVLERRAADYQRVYATAERLSRANVELCARTRPTLGVRFENLNDYGRDFKTAARELWGLSDAVSVAWVGENSPAARAGLRVRDEVVAINGRAIPQNRRASRQAFTTLRDVSDEGAVALRIRRGGQELDLVATPDLDCAYQFVMVDDDAINASADGSTIMLNRGMLRFVESDEELALILGHELAHNAMGHIESMQQNAIMGTIGGAILDIAAAAAGVNTGGAFTDAGGDIGRIMFAQEFESEADYVGMYFMARAGYEVEGVEGFWRRMSAESPRGIRLAYTHPNNAARFLGLTAARTEISRKVAAGLPLRPTMRGEEDAVLHAEVTAPETGESAAIAGAEEPAAEQSVVPAQPASSLSDPSALPATNEDAISLAPSTP